MKQNLILLGTALAFCLLAAELVLRLVGLGRPLVHEHDPKLLWRMPANQVAYAPSYRVSYRTNAQGWRENEDVALAPAPGEFRILALGDSVLFGQGVPYEETLTQRLEASLRPPPGFDSVDVVNTAVSGWCLFQYKTFLSDGGFDYRPDLLLLGFVKNDVLSERDVEELRERAREGRQANIGDLSSKMRRSSAILHAMHGLYMRIRAAWSPEPPALAFEGAEVTDTSWPYTIELLTWIAESAKERGIPLVVMVFPSREEVESRRVVKSIGPIESLREALGFHLVDLHPTFAQHASQPLFLDSVHPTSRGNEIAAETVLDYLRESAVLEERAGLRPTASATSRRIAPALR